MRIVGGEWRSRIIEAPASGLRPTADRVREAVFNILSNVVDFEECTVCDLFAGSGAMGIEALSRGAESAVFVEHHQSTAAIIEKNLRGLGAEDRGKIIVGDALKFACTSEEKADIVFADPPYDFNAFDDVAKCVLDRRMFTRYFVLEHSSSAVIEAGSHVPWKQRKFGASAVTIFSQELP